MTPALLSACLLLGAADTDSAPSFEKQIAPLRALVQGVLEQHPEERSPHTLAAAPEQVDGEEVARQLDAAERELQAGGNGQGAPLPLLTLARLRERVADLADRAAWVRDESARKHLLRRSGDILKKLG